MTVLVDVFGAAVLIIGAVLLVGLLCLWLAATAGLVWIAVLRPGLELIVILCVAAGVAGLCQPYAGLLVGASAALLFTPLLARPLIGLAAWGLDRRAKRNPSALYPPWTYVVRAARSQREAAYVPPPLNEDPEPLESLGPPSGS